MSVTKGKVLVAMSGGVDSSVSALLLQKQGYECIGATMHLRDRVDAGNQNSADVEGSDASGQVIYSESADDAKHSKCEGSANSAGDFSTSTALNAADIRDAKAVCKVLGIEHHVLDMRAEFEKCVVEPFVELYESGSTPNPCVTCNKYLKFGKLLDAARQMGCDYIATGHYAKVIKEGDRFMLSRSESDGKDQSYVLYNFTQDQLAHVIFPLSDMEKNEVRKIAKENALPVAQKSESQDICFIPDGDYVNFIENYRGKPFEPGNVVDLQGNVVGTHCGAACFTIGQRRGLGVALGEPAYVCDKDMSTNVVVVGSRENLMSRGCFAKEWNWILPEPEIGQQISAYVKTNYRQTPHPATLEKLSTGEVKVIYNDKLYPKAVRGQSVVAYSHKYLLGGGIISRAIMSSDE